MAVASGQLERLTESCRCCSLRYLCLPYGLSANDLDRLDALVIRDAELGSADSLFVQGDGLKAIYAIREGSMKRVVIDEDGFEQILGVTIPAIGSASTALPSKATSAPPSRSSRPRSVVFLSIVWIRSWIRCPACASNSCV